MRSTSPSAGQAELQTSTQTTYITWSLEELQLNLKFFRSVQPHMDVPRFFELSMKERAGWQETKVGIYETESIFYEDSSSNG
jgi:hypothetical protein